jgi:hypothetical protein
MKGEDPAMAAPGTEEDLTGVLKDIRDELKKVRHRGWWLAAGIAVLALVFAVYAIVNAQHDASLTRNLCLSANTRFAENITFWDEWAPGVVSRESSVPAFKAGLRHLYKPRDCAHLRPPGS